MKEFYMSKAIELAKKGIGFVNPDPLIGIIIVKNGRILTEWYHRTAFDTNAGGAQALKGAIMDSEGEELYINIFPFSICECIQSISDFIIKSSIRKVYIGMLIPEIHSGAGDIDALREAGIEIEVGILGEQCSELNEIYSYYVSTGLPFVFTKWAMTLDGKLATRMGDSKWISSEDSLKFVHHLRQRTAAIMVGENTVRLDNPLLTTRLEKVEISNPIRVVLSKYGNISPDANVLKVDEKVKTLIAASEGIPAENERMLLEKGVEVLKFHEHDGRIDFKEIAKALGSKKIDSLYIEGGSEVLASAFESGVVNKVYAAVAPKIIGGRNAVTPVGGIGIEKMKDAIVLKRVSHEIVGNDVIIKGYL